MVEVQKAITKETQGRFKPRISLRGFRSRAASLPQRDASDWEDDLPGSDARTKAIAPLQR
jgi:hypothetical protein